MGTIAQRTIESLSEEYTEIFKEAIKDFPEYAEAIEIGRRNSRDEFRIIGGFVYRNIIRKLYGGPPMPSKIDIDLLIGEPNRMTGYAVFDEYVPPGWDVELTRYKNLYMTRGRIRIDRNYLHNFRSIAERGLRFTFEHHLTGTPLNIQSISYSYLTGKVIGRIGIEAIHNKIVKVNNLPEAILDSRDIGITVEEMVKNKATSVGFSYEL